MVRLICAVAVLMQLTSGTQEAAAGRDDSGVVVLKSSWSKSVQDPGALTPTLHGGRHGGGMGRMGRRGRGREQAREGFDYKLKVRNTTEKAVTSVLWEYQTGGPGAAQDAPGQQFQCQEKVKPGATKSLEVFSPSPPTHIVNASGGGDADAATAVTAVIDRVEYADGTRWERAGWEKPKNATPYPADLYSTPGKSKCSGF
jgi:hypothetical protein